VKGRTLILITVLRSKDLIFVMCFCCWTREFSHRSNLRDFTERLPVFERTPCHRSTVVTFVLGLIRTEVLTYSVCIGRELF
jgi:hypothetical protein